MVDREQGLPTQASVQVAIKKTNVLAAVVCQQTSETQSGGSCRSRNRFLFACLVDLDSRADAVLVGRMYEVLTLGKCMRPAAWSSSEDLP